MLLLTLIFLSLSEPLNIAQFENSQRIKGLGTEFSRMIEDTFTDLVYEPGLSAFLASPVLIAEFSHDSIPVYRAGYFTPSLPGNFSAGIYLEGALNKLYYGTENENNVYWARSIINLSHLLKDKKSAFSLGADITLGRNQYYNDNVNTIYDEKLDINNYKIMLSYIVKHENIPTRINMDYIKNNETWNRLETRHSHNTLSWETDYGDTITYLHEHITSSTTQDTFTSKTRQDSLRLSFITAILPSENNKTILFASVKTGLSEQYDYDHGYAYRYFTLHTYTRIRQDSCDTSATMAYGELGSSKYHCRCDFRKSINDWAINIGIARQSKLNDKLDAFYGIRMNYLYLYGGDRENVSIPLAVEYKTSPLCIRFGVTTSGYNRDHKITLSNTYAFGLGLNAARGLYIDFSNQGELIKPEDRQIGIIKKF